MSEFETRLHECLEALSQGRWNLDECLRRYPEHADELRAHLVAASTLAHAYQATPREEWASAARERFLIATGQRLQEAMDLEPEPSFFAAARVRFLLAAQRLRMEGATARRPRRLPVFGSPMRAFGAAAASVVLFLGFSAYTVSTASAALPGDWRYPIKLQTERVRLALAITDAQERAVRLDIAEERVEEIEELAYKGRIIPPGALDRLVKNTEPLIEDASEGRLDREDAARLQEMSVRTTQVLSAASSQVDPSASDKLVAAQDVTKEALAVTRALAVADPDRPPVVVAAPNVVETPTHEPTAAPTDVPDEPTAQPSPQASPEPGDTPAAEDGLTPTDDVIIASAPIIDFPGVTLYVLQAGRLVINAPGPGSGWYIENAPATGVPPLLTFKTQDQSSIVVVSTLTGDLYWFYSPARNGRYDEIQLRVTRDGQAYEAAAESLRDLYGAAAEVPIYMLQSVRLLEAPAPEAAPTTTPVVTPNAP